MDLSVKPEDVTRVLEDVRILLKDNIIPRLHELEYENHVMRRITWPVCQLHFEKSQTDAIKFKARTLAPLDNTQIKNMLLDKERISRDLDGYNPSKMGRVDQEYNEIKNYIKVLNNGHTSQ